MKDYPYKIKRGGGGGKSLSHPEGGGGRGHNMFWG